MGASWADCKSKKLSFWSVIFSYSVQQQRSDCDVQWKVDFIQPATTSSVIRPRRSSKSLPKAKLAPKKRSGSLCSGLLPMWLTAAFWIPVKQLHLRSCSANQWDVLKTAKLAASFGQQKGPHSSPWSCPTAWQQPVLQKWNKWGCGVLPHPPYSPDLSSADYHFFSHLDNFFQGTCFQNQQEPKNAFQEFIESQRTDFYAVGINLFLIGKN